MCIYDRPRRSMKKARKAKRYVSLRRRLTSTFPAPRDKEKEKEKEEDKSVNNIFEVFADYDTNVISLLNPDIADEVGAPSLAAFLTISSPSPSTNSSSMIWDDASGEIAMRALRGRERLAFCSSSSAGGGADASSPKSEHGDDNRSWRRRSPLLKLDYDEIIAAWSDRGPPYIDDNGGSTSTWGSSAATVGLPEGKRDSVVAMGDDDHVTATKVIGAREERVQRYREKRRSRHFNKRIRYEVRKVNAEKRPRLKGRFVKRTKDIST